MKINLERINDKYLFEVTNKNGHKVHLDRKYSDNYNVKGASPMELLLMGVAGCSSIDIIFVVVLRFQDYSRIGTSIGHVLRCNAGEVLTC